MYPASVILATAGLDPHQVALRCGLGDVDRVPVAPAPRWLESLWIGPVAATTVPWAIYVRREVLFGERRRLARLLVHELVHVRQWSELGVIRFLLRYLGEYVAGRLRGRSHLEAYRAISLESEARDVGDV